VCPFEVVIYADALLVAILLQFRKNLGAPLPQEARIRTKNAFTGNYPQLVPKLLNNLMQVKFQNKIIDAILPGLLGVEPVLRMLAGKPELFYSWPSNND
jgi:hypothetical protein